MLTVAFPVKYKPFGIYFLKTANVNAYSIDKVTGPAARETEAK